MIRKFKGLFQKMNASKLKGTIINVAFLIVLRTKIEIKVMDNCTLDCILIQGNLNISQMCTFTQSQCHQDTVQFVQAYYCLFRGSFMILIFLGIPLFLLLFKTLNVIAQEYLSPCVEVFIQEFKISPTLAGVTFLAFANGAPDVMTAIIAGSSESDSTALIPFGSIFGALLFSSAFILSAVILLQDNQTIQLKLRQLVIPLSFYIVSTSFIILVSVIYGKMNMYLASVLILLYAVYIVLTLKSEKDLKIKQSLLKSVDSNDQNLILSKVNQAKPEAEVIEVTNQKQEKQQESLVDKVDWKINEIEKRIFSYIVPFYKIEQWHPLRTIVSLVVSPFMIALTQEVPHIFKAFVGPIPVFLLICLPSIILLAYTIYCIARKQQPYYIKVFTIYSFFISISALTVVCSILINFVELVQLLTEVNSVFLGLTVFAWANSIGDYLTITHFAKLGNAKTAIAGIFSGQLFNFALGFGVSLFIQSMNGEYEYKIFDFQGSTYDKVSDSIVMVVIFGSLVYLIYVLIAVIKNKGLLMRRQALFGRWYYVGFLMISCFLALLTDFFRQIECSL